MATNQRQNIRTLHRPAADIVGLTQAQILQLIQSETVAGAQADVTGLQVGDIITVTPSDVGAPIEDAHNYIVAPPGQNVARVFIVADAQGVPAAPGVAPVIRHLLIEIPCVQTIFW